MPPEGCLPAPTPVLARLLRLGVAFQGQPDQQLRTTQLGMSEGGCVQCFGEVI